MNMLKTPLHYGKLLLYLAWRIVYLLTLTPIFFILVALTFNNPTACARVFKTYFKWNGSIFIKIGQVLAQRYDLLPIEVCEALYELLDGLPAVPTEAIERIIAEDFGQTTTELFAWFNPAALSTASISQVHEARLISGEVAVVKVLKPGIRAKFKRDFFILRALARFVSFFSTRPNPFLLELVRETETLTMEEFDFPREAFHIQHMHRLMNDDGLGHYAPALYPNFCSNRVITMEKIEGIPLIKIISAKEGGTNDPETMAEIDRLAALVLRSIFMQTIRYGTFHADPHAANLILMKDGRLGWIDFGMLGQLDKRMLDLQFKLREAVADNQIDKAYQYLLATFRPIPAKNLTTFEKHAKAGLRDWMMSSTNHFFSIREKSTGLFFLNILQEARKAGLIIPFQLSRLYRTIIIGDMVILKLNKDIDWMEELQAFVAAERQRRVEDEISRIFSFNALKDAANMVIRLPRFLNTVYDWTEDRLPELQTTYLNRISGLEQLFVQGLVLVRGFVLLYLCALAGYRIFHWRDKEFPEIFLKLHYSTADNFFIRFVAGLFLLMILNRAVRIIVKQDG